VLTTSGSVANWADVTALAAYVADQASRAAQNIALALVL